MIESQFVFLDEEFESVSDAARRAERYGLTDPGTSIIHARRALESGVKWAFNHDPDLGRPYEDKLNAYLNEPIFKHLADGNVFRVAKKVQLAGNRAVHDSKAPTPLQAVEVLSALFEFCFWLSFTYGREPKPDPSLRFDPNLLVDLGDIEQKSLAERRELERHLEQEAADRELVRIELEKAAKTIEQLEAERVDLLAEVAAAKAAAERVTGEPHDWSEAETRLFKIDALLMEAGWRLDQEWDREYEVRGMPSASGIGYVDYVLWGDDGKPLAVVEAKKATVNPSVGQQQAKLYADCLEEMHGQRPLIFYTNGYEHWIWDDTELPPRRVQGFYTRGELELAIQRRGTRKPLSTLQIDREIVERYYQRRSIRAISELFEVDKQRKALLVMATGAGKTRTVIALVELLMRANLVKRVLFLADRVALVNQAVNAFKTHLPDSAPVNLVTEGGKDGRVFVSTYPTMVGKIDEIGDDSTRRFGTGYFDLVIIDEAHRSVYRKYRGIFDYFDSYLVGLTATPKDEVDKNTYDLFDLETGVPTDAYSLDEAVNDGFLVPPKGMSVPLKFAQRGIKYDDLSEDEKDDWDELDWGENEDGTLLAPNEVGASQINKWLFNEDTVDKVLAHLMTNGIKVAGGDRLGKTIIFAKNQKHANYIYERFIASYPALDSGNFARVITHDTKYAQSLIDDFSNKEKAPHIAISVDMLDTGIDIPECVNLVFFKQVRSKTKFWQMLGRGTRLCPNLFGPNDDKTAFNVFDFCGNLEYFSQDLEPAATSTVVPLGERVFKARLELIQEMVGSQGLAEDRAEIASTLHTSVASMNTDNFLVRPHAELVEQFQKPEAWPTASIGDLAALADRVAQLPDGLAPEPEEAKRFDILLLDTQLAVLRDHPIERQRKKIMQIASLLEDQETIPAIATQLELIEDIQRDEWWVDVTYRMLELIRKRLRPLVPLIERAKKGVIYSDFTDAIGVGEAVDLPGTGGAIRSDGFEQFRKKARFYLRQQLDAPVVAKVRSGEHLSHEDLANLRGLLESAGIGNDESFNAAAANAGSFGLFVRSLVGLDREAAKAAFADFLDEDRYTKNQIAFVNLIINYLTEHGSVEPGRIYESPFTGVAPEGPDGLFESGDVGKIFQRIELLTASAA